MKVKVKSLSHVRLFATLWTVAYQAPPSMGFSRQEYWSGLPVPSPGDLPNPGIEPGSPTFQADALTSEPPGTPLNHPSGLLTCHKSTSPLLPSSSYVISQGYLHLLECFGTPPASGKCHCFGDTQTLCPSLYHLPKSKCKGKLQKQGQKKSRR